MMRRLLRPQQLRGVSSLVAAFDQSVKDLPMREAMRYKAKNIKWSATEFKTYVDGQAEGLVDLEFKKGEAVSVWMRNGAEKDVTFMALAKAGLKLVEAPEVMTVPQLRQFLAIADCKAIYFDPVTDTQDRLLQLRKAIPEFFDFDDKHGQLFHSKYFPALRYFIHTGFDLECGCYNYKRLMLVNPVLSRLDKVSSGLSNTDPLYMKAEIGRDGNVIAGKWLTHEDVLKQNVWSFEKNIRDKKYFET